MLSHLFTELNKPLDPIPTGLTPKLPKLKNMRAIIFDIYGTLVVSGTGDISIAQSLDLKIELHEILSKNGFSISENNSILDTFYSLIKVEHARAITLGVLHPEVDILEIWSNLFESLFSKIPEEDTLRKIAIEFECAANPVWPMPHMMETLHYLKSGGFELGIVSNAQFYTPLMMEDFTGKSLSGLGFRNDLSIWSYREKLGKPSVELFEKLTRNLSTRGILPDQALYVGNDLLNDIWSASQVGLKTALFAGDQRSLRLRESDKRCISLNPDVVITSLPQLFKVI